MGLFRALIAIAFPPLSVIDKGCGAFNIGQYFNTFGMDTRSYSSNNFQ